MDLTDLAFIGHLYQLGFCLIIFSFGYHGKYHKDGITHTLSKLPPPLSMASMAMAVSGATYSAEATRKHLWFLH